MSSSAKSAFVVAPLTIPGLYATTDLSSSQFKAVKLLTTAGRVNLAGTSVVASMVIGLLQNNPKGTATLPVNAEVAVGGIAKGIAGTSIIKKGDSLSVNTTSNLVPSTTDNAWIIGKALGASAAIGDIIPVLMYPGVTRY